MEFALRLRKVFPGLSIAEIARKLEIPHATVRNYFNGRLPATEILIKIADETDVSLNWLLTGKGDDDQATALFARAPTADLEPGQIPIYFGPKEQEMIRDIAKEAGQTFEQEVRGIVLTDLQRRGLVNQPEQSNIVFFGEPVRSVNLPLMGWIAAGEPIHAIPDKQEVNVPDFFQKKGKQYFVLHVRGDSMIEDEIVDNSLIICEARTTAQDGEKVVALIDGDKATVKRLYHEGDRIRLQPANPTHKPIYVGPGQHLDIQGVVVGIFHKPS